MKKLLILFTLIICVYIPLFSQELFTLDNAINDYTTKLVPNIQSNRGVAVIAFETDSNRLMEYFIDTMTERLWEEGIRPVYERRRLEILQKELDYSLSGAVSDETVLRIGQRIGVNTVIYGSLINIGNNYRVVIRTTNVETAEFVFPASYDLKMDARLKGLLGISRQRKEWDGSIGTGMVSGINDTGESLWDRNPYFNPFFYYSYTVIENLQLNTELNFEFGFQDPDKYIRLHFDLGATYWLFFNSSGLSLRLKHKIYDFQITPEVSNGSIMSNVFTPGFSYNISLSGFGDIYTDLDFSIQYLFMAYEDRDTEVRFNTKFGWWSNFGLGFWVMPHFDLSRNAMWSVGRVTWSDKKDDAYLGSTFEVSYNFNRLFSFPLFIYIQMLIPNYDDYGIDLTFRVEFFDIGPITVWFDFPIGMLGNNKIYNSSKIDPIVDFKLGFRYRFK